MSFSNGRVFLSVAFWGMVLAGFPLSARAQCQFHHHHHRGGGMSPVMQQQRLQRILLQQQVLQQHILRQQDLKLKDLDREIRELAAAGVPAVKLALKSIRAETRWAAAHVVGMQNLPLRDELIRLLTDSNASVRQAAREALVELSTEALLAKNEDGKSKVKRVDFGPALQAGPSAQKTAARKWRTWWERMDSGHMDVKSLTAKNAVRSPSLPKIAPPVPTALEAEAARLSEELVQASASRHEAVLNKLRDSKGVVYTDALAGAIPSLNGEARDQARDALTERLTRMKAATLRDKLQDDNSEVRGAAALACAMKEAKSRIPDLIALLDDPERFVALAAKTALKNLTGQNFGRVVGVARVEKMRAIGDWNEWWRKHNGE